MHVLRSIFLLLIILLTLYQFSYGIENSSSSYQSYPGCGVPLIHGSKIVGGQETTAGKWPWQAALKETDPDGSQFITCGGTLLNERWVITATHCTKGTEAQYLHVLLGTLDYNLEETFAREYPVSRIVNHPDYISVSQGNDITLLKIGATVIMSEYILPACLPRQGMDVTVGLNCTISGWGTTQVATDDRSVLREAVVPIISNSVCSSWYSGQLFYGITDVLLCAGYEAGGIDTCQGDSGGPLVCQANSTEPYQLEGITSFGIGCAEANNPGVYTRVSEYVSWIEESIQNNPGTDPFFALPQTPCGSVISTNQILRLPVDDETQIYQKNINCLWTLKTNGKGILLKFVERFAVEKGDTCHDYVTIESDTGHTIVSQLCGYTLPIDISITSGQYDSAKITFSSDLSIQFEGFAMEVSFQEPFPSTTATTASTISGSSRHLYGKLPFIFAVVSTLLSVV